MNFSKTVFYMSFTLHDLSDELPSGLYWIYNGFPHWVGTNGEMS